MPVWGGELLAHFDADGALVRVNGRYVPVAVAAAERGQERRRGARARRRRRARARVRHVVARRVHHRRAEAVRLSGRRDDGEARRGACRSKPPTTSTSSSSTRSSTPSTAASCTSPTSPPTPTAAASASSAMRQPLVVAKDGASYILEDATRGSPATRTYSAGGHDAAAGHRRAQQGSASWDTAGAAAGAAVDAHAFVARTLGLLRQGARPQRLGRQEQGRARHRPLLRSGYDNAFFDGKQLVFGDGDGTDFSPLSGALDVVAHEFTHGVTAHTAQPRHGRARTARSTRRSPTSSAASSRATGRWARPSTTRRAAPPRCATSPNPHASNNPATMTEYVETTDGQRRRARQQHHRLARRLPHDAAQAAAAPPSRRSGIARSRATCTPRPTSRDAADATIVGRARSRRRRRERSCRTRGSTVGRDRVRCAVLDDEAELRRLGYAQQLGAG